MKKANVLVSKEVSDNIDLLKNDPIILKMYLSLPEKFRTKMLSGDWDDISRCNEKYHEFGGNNAINIGGPHEAICELILEQRSAGKVG
jgi:hypothetical protein